MAKKAVHEMQTSVTNRKIGRAVSRNAPAAAPPLFRRIQKMPYQVKYPALNSSAASYTSIYASYSAVIPVSSSSNDTLKTNVASMV